MNSEYYVFKVFFQKKGGIFFVFWLFHWMKIKCFMISICCRHSDILTYVQYVYHKYFRWWRIQFVFPTWIKSHNFWYMDLFRVFRSSCERQIASVYLKWSSKFLWCCVLVFCFLLFVRKYWQPTVWQLVYFIDFNI